MTVQLGTDDLLFTEKWADRVAAKKGKTPPDVAATQNPSTVKGDKQNIRISSDPYIVPNLIKRFYRIPAEVVQWGRENMLEVRLYGEHATGISEPVYIREVSTPEQQREIINFDNDRMYLGDLKTLTPVDLDVQVVFDTSEIPAGESIPVLIKLRNNTDQMAFFAGLKVKGIEEITTQIYSDNWTWVLPNSEKRIWVNIANDKKATGSYQTQFELTGWNVIKKNVGSEFKVILK